MLKSHTTILRDASIDRALEVETELLAEGSALSGVERQDLRREWVRSEGSRQSFLLSFSFFF